MKGHFTRRIGSKAVRMGAALSMALAMCALPATAQAQQNEDAAQLVTATNTDTSAATTNDKAMSAYKAVLHKLKKGANVELVAYEDLDGNGIKELVCIYRPNPVQGSGEFEVIYTYRNGKARKIFDFASGILGQITYSQKSNSFVYYRRGHGHEMLHYYKLKDGKYCQVASKGRMSTHAGAEKNSRWVYSVHKGSTYKDVTKKVFKKRIAKLQKGKLHTVTMHY